MDPATLLLLKKGVEKGMSYLPDAVKVIASIKQGHLARKLGRTQRPAYEIPNAATQGLETAQANYADIRLPGQDYISGQIQNSTAQLIRAAKEAGRTPAEILAAAAAGNTNQNDALQQLAIQGANQQNQDASNLYGQQQQMAGYQEKQWGWNKQTPYVANMNAAGALRNASGLNLVNGLKGAAATTLASGKQSETTSGVNSDAYTRILQKWGLAPADQGTGYIPPDQRTSMNPDRTLNLPESWDMKQALWDMKNGRPTINNPGR